MRFTGRFMVAATIATTGLIFAAGFGSSAGAQEQRICDGRVATIVGTPGDDTIEGTDGPDVIAALQGNDVIRGMDGDDIICAGVGNDVVYGGEGFDIIFGAQGNDVIYASEGAPLDTFFSREDIRGARMFGGSGNDVIHGSNKWDRMQGGPGTDVLHGYEGQDWMRGGADRDTVIGGAGKDDLHGGNGTDFIRLTAGDLVRGGAGNDRCINVAAAAKAFSCESNPAVAETLSSDSLGFVSGRMTRCAIKPGFIGPTTAEGVVTNTGTEIIEGLSIKILLLDAAGREIGEHSASTGNLLPGETSMWHSAVSPQVPPDGLASCVLRLVKTRVATPAKPGSEFNVRFTDCGSSSESPLGGTVRQFSGTVTNTTNEAKDIRVIVYPFNNAGLRGAGVNVFLDPPFAPGETREFATASSFAVPPGQYARCSAFVHAFTPR